MKIRFALITLTMSFFVFAQTTNANLNKTLKEYRQAMLAGKYESLADYIYPKVFTNFGGKQNVLMMLKLAGEKTKQQGIHIKSIAHKHAGKMAIKDSEIQIPIKETTIVESTKDKKRYPTELLVIAISEDQGKTWKFINTMNQSKEQLLKFFPNLSPDLEIKSMDLSKARSIK